MTIFNGFQAGKSTSVWVPAQFFEELLPLIDDFAELQLSLFCFWALKDKDAEHIYLRRHDFLSCAHLLQSFKQASPNVNPVQTLDRALNRALNRGTLLAVTVVQVGRREEIYFANTPAGREMIAKVESGAWQPDDFGAAVEVLPDRPDIFRIYEGNIGVLTPMIADELKDAEQTYPIEWIEEAIRLAVTHNKRNWKYALAILKRWQSEGKDSGLFAKQAEQNSTEYITPEFARFLTFKRDDE